MRIQPSKETSTTIIRILAVIGLFVGLLLPLGMSSAQASTCAGSWPQWSSTKAITYKASSAWQMCDAGGSSIRLTFQTDGNLVYYRGATAIWSSQTSGSGKEFRLEKDGSISVYGCSGTNCTQAYHLLWSSYTTVTGSGWQFFLTLSIKPGTSTLYVLNDQVSSDGTNHLHYIGAGAAD